MKEKLLARLNDLGSEGPKRSLGQNFLVSEHIVEKIISAVERSKSAEIIEVGPGLGSLTDELINLKKPLHLIELDQKFAQYWRERASAQEGMSIIEGDALQISWQELSGPNAILVSNLPYQISSSLVIDRCLNPQNINAMVLMFQKEVAQRLTAQARSKDYGLLTVIAQNFWRIDFLCDCSPRDYYPPPNVASRVLVFKLLEDSLEVSMRENFLAFVKSGFAHRRKLLFGNLKSRVPQEKLSAAFEKAGIAAQARAEELTPEKFRELFLLSR